MKVRKASISWQMRGAEPFSVNALDDSFVAFGTKMACLCVFCLAVRAGRRSSNSFFGLSKLNLFGLVLLI